MIERTIVLPVLDNDGNSLVEPIRRIQGELLGICGGYSCVKQSGVWIDAGTIYDDESLRIVTAVEEEQDSLISNRLPAWCEWLKQLCLYTSTSNVTVRLVEPACERVHA